MKGYKNTIEKLLIKRGQEYSAKTILGVVAMLIAISPLCALSQTSDEIPAPVVDYHIHIQSLKMSRWLTPEQPTVDKLPEEFERLLRDKEKYGAKVKNVPALTDLYTKDALVLESGNPVWRKGGPAIDYVFYGTSIARLVPTGYEMNGSLGYITGYETDFSTPPRPVSSFIYTLRKESDGKWRISTESFTPNGHKVAVENTPDDIVAELDAGGIRKAAALSVAFVFGSEDKPTAPGEYENVKSENDWIAKSVARFPDRLVGFCSFNPLKDYALDELNRCAKLPQIKGLKFHFADSGVDLRKPEHIEKVRRVFEAANKARMPIVVHLATRQSPSDADLARQQASGFLNGILEVAPDITVEVAHMSGDSYYPLSSDAGMEVFANAVSAGDKRTKNLYFQAVSSERLDEAAIARLVKRMRQIGMNKFLNASDRTNASDRAGGKNPAPGNNWKLFTLLPLTKEEFKTVAGNVLPHMR
jgi:predicted TIM-barrel fold metal-dependent hydrolase